MTDRTNIADFCPCLPLHTLKFYWDNVQIDLQQSYDKLIQSCTCLQKPRAGSLTSHVFSTQTAFCWLSLLIFSESVQLYLRKGDEHLRHITWPRVTVSQWHDRIKVTRQKFYSVVNAMACRRWSFECSELNTVTMTMATSYCRFKSFERRLGPESSMLCLFAPWCARIIPKCDHAVRMLAP